MNTLSAPQRTDHRQSDLPAPLRLTPLHDRTPRTSLPDRIALRIALWLLLWSTRPLPRTSSAEQHRHTLERERREREWQLRYHRLPLI
jgi:hypothetical protein